MKVPTCLPQPAPASSMARGAGNRPLRFLSAKCRRWIAGLCLVLFAATNPAIGRAGSGPVTYAYDELGRLIAVVDGSGNAAQYNYDAVGNLLSITIPPGPVSLFTFTPNNGPVAMNVTIYGDGFSTTPSNNTVTFYNGKNVTPTAPTTVATITVPVPSGATKGPIKVTVAGVGSATSTADFTVTAN